jgi:hypothetical protein
MLSDAMAYDTINRDVQEWQRIDVAVAFRLTNGDEYLIARRVMCPDCGHAYVFGLANGDMVSFARRHPHCKTGDEEQDNGS